LEVKYRTFLVADEYRLMSNVRKQNYGRHLKMRLREERKGSLSSKNEYLLRLTGTGSFILGNFYVIYFINSRSTQSVNVFGVLPLILKNPPQDNLFVF
jgi:hypothetical protein